MRFPLKSIDNGGATLLVTSLAVAGCVATRTGEWDGALTTPIHEPALLAHTWFQPAMDYDTDSCYNSPAVDENGSVDKGEANMAPNRNPYNFGFGVSESAGCRDAARLSAAQSYSRGRCNHGWCVVMYAFYFEKDPGDFGHRYDWEHVAVWSSYEEPDDNGYPTIKHISVSQHGGWKKKAVDKIHLYTGVSGSHPKVVYHQDGGLTHAFRFADWADDRIENHSGHWMLDEVLSVSKLSKTVRDKLANNDWGSAEYDLSNGRFPRAVKRSKPREVPNGLDWTRDDPKCVDRMKIDGFC